MRVFTTLLICLFFSLFATCTVEPIKKIQTLEDSKLNTFNINNVFNSTIALVSFEKKKITCTAFFVAENLVVTAKHCVLKTAELMALESKKQSSVEFMYYGQIVHGVVYAMHLKSSESELEFYNSAIPLRVVYLTNKYNKKPRLAGEDIAVLQILDKEYYAKNWFNVAKKEPEVGDKIYFVGMPMGLYWTAYKGILSKKIPYTNGNIRAYYVNIFVAPGASGSPLFNEFGEAIGVISSGFFPLDVKQANVGVAMSHYNLKKHIEAAKKLINVDKTNN